MNEEDGGPVSQESDESSTESRKWPRTLRALRVAGRWSARIGGWLLVWVGLTLLAAGWNIRQVWGDITVDQMLTNITGVRRDGGGGDLAIQAVWWIGVVPLVATVLLAVIVYLLRRPGRKRAGRTSKATGVRRIAAVQSPTGRGLRRFGAVVPIALVTAIAVTGTATFSSAVSMPDYIRAVRSNLDLGPYYAQPTVDRAAAKKVAGGKKNLVLIYLESGEATLGDDSVFEKDMLAPAKEATQGWAGIDGLQQYHGGGWTMAGIVSSQCGIPLRGKSAATGDKIMNELGTELDSFMSGQTCLGDVLADNGYTNTFIGGANADFAAKGTFLRTHGYDTIKDLKTWRAAGEASKDIRSDWGLSDKRLMEHAKDEVDQLHKKSQKTGKPFNLSMLTLDTHEPVHVYDSCKVDTQDQLASVFSCSMATVAGFLDHMKDKGYLDDTTVVVMGDHLKHMAGWNAYHEELDGRDDRTVFNRIWVPGTKNGKTPLGTPRAGVDQLNWLPTIMDAVGVPATGSRAGLGVSAFAPEIPAESAQALDENKYKELLDARSGDFYARAWGEAK
ncbi:sulfatase-like hydrolase/transferase [Brevibacterium sp. 50QC2O2]|uniref:sulfatase-like hydrolase/transferase n=1 Tax=Brevibacterium TaxID=1696 RepID=UPI00211CBFA3|nr:MULTISPECIES: sulfatase-like hydrolase/transferase [unclassified Brevibacterium]MCQ9368139.1 sulfatase-like hydrolase/transferase [Brevibacterium sp. 91QC2O2]MCQ9386042.1 sulfatase-like hydrolase/transferase [Brevibacterium sp. 68QC2CO]MCQ9387666.1 sulfatase-like hydrolase/transferase [Brevibacterium sp. 50QC2O2]